MLNKIKLFYIKNFWHKNKSSFVSGQNLYQKKTTKDGKIGWLISKDKNGKTATFIPAVEYWFDKNHL